MIRETNFLLLAGDPDKWDAEIRRRCRPAQPGMMAEDLSSVQSEQYGRGRRAAEVIRSVYGFGVRSGYGFDNFAIMQSPKLGSLDGSMEAAVRWGVEWVEADPGRREIIVSWGGIDNWTNVSASDELTWEMRNGLLTGIVKGVIAGLLKTDDKAAVAEMAEFIACAAGDKPVWRLTKDEFQEVVFAAREAALESLQKGKASPDGSVLGSPPGR